VSESGGEPGQNTRNTSTNSSPLLDVSGSGLPSAGGGVDEHVVASDDEGELDEQEELDESEEEESGSAVSGAEEPTRNTGGEENEENVEIPISSGDERGVERLPGSVSSASRSPLAQPPFSNNPNNPPFSRSAYIPLSPTSLDPNRCNGSIPSTISGQGSSSINRRTNSIAAEKIPGVNVPLLPLPHVARSISTAASQSGPPTRATSTHFAARSASHSSADPPLAFPPTIDVNANVNECAVPPTLGTPAGVTPGTMAANNYIPPRYRGLGGLTTAGGKPDDGSRGEYRDYRGEYHHSTRERDGGDNHRAPGQTVRDVGSVYPRLPSLSSAATQPVGVHSAEGQLVGRNPPYQEMRGSPRLDAPPHQWPPTINPHSSYGIPPSPELLPVVPPPSDTAAGGLGGRGEKKAENWHQSGGMVMLLRLLNHQLGLTCVELERLVLEVPSFKGFVLHYRAYMLAPAYLFTLYLLQRLTGYGQALRYAARFSRPFYAFRPPPARPPNPTPRAPTPIAIASSDSTRTISTSFSSQTAVPEALAAVGSIPATPALIASALSSTPLINTATNTPAGGNLSTYVPEITEDVPGSAAFFAVLSPSDLAPTAPLPHQYVHPGPGALASGSGIINSTSGSSTRPPRSLHTAGWDLYQPRPFLASFTSGGSDGALGGMGSGPGVAPTPLSFGKSLLAIFKGFLKTSSSSLWQASQLALVQYVAQRPAVKVAVHCAIFLGMLMYDNLCFDV